MTKTESPDQQGHPWFKKIRQRLHVRVILPLVVGLGLLAYVISIAAVPQSGEQLWRVIRSTWWLILLLTIPYLALRALIWHELLEQVGVAVPWRPMLASFAGGEITKSLPAGVYVQNYLLARLEHFDDKTVARTTMASTAMLGLEAALAFPVALLFGWPNRPDIRWILLGIIVAWVVGLMLAWLLVRYGARHMSESTPQWLRRVTGFIEGFLETGSEIVAWRTARNLLPTALYMLIYVVDLYAIARALGIGNISFLDALAIYAFVILSVILIPIPTEVGITEFTGLAAFAAYGIPGPTAAIIMLGLRLIATGLSIVVSGVILLLLRKQLSRAIHATPEEGKSEDEGETDEDEDEGTAGAAQIPGEGSRT